MNKILKLIFKNINQICADCKWSKNHVTTDAIQYLKCTNPKQYKEKPKNLVTGEIKLYVPYSGWESKNPYCSFHREMLITYAIFNKYTCGKMGKWWELKENA